MEKINLDISPKYKVIHINGKDINIPKLGLKHHAIIMQSESFEDGTKKLLNSISKNLSVAERDLVSLHLLNYNGKLKDSVVIDGIKYTLDDVYISQKLKFYIDDVEYRFKSPNLETLKPTIDKLLQECCISVKKDGINLDIPDFMDMPAYTYKWAESILDTIALKTESKEIKGITKLMEIFNGS